MQQVAADEYGGVVALITHQTSGEYSPHTVRRYNGATGRLSWEYVAYWDVNNASHLSDFAIAPDGRVLFVEGRPSGTYLVALAGDTGAVSQLQLPAGLWDTMTTHPLVLDDGTIIVLSSRPLANGTRELQRVSVASGTLSATITTVDSSVLSVSAAARFDAEMFRLMPDGTGGLLLTPHQIDMQSVAYPYYWGTVSSDVYRISPAGVLSGPLRLVPNLGRVSGVGVYHADYVLGEDAAWVYLEGYGTNGFWARTLSFDPVTLAVRTDTPLDEPRGDPWYLRLRSALAGGGVYLSGPSEARTIGASINAAGFASGGNSSPIPGGLWMGWNLGAGLTLGSEAPEGQTKLRQPRAEGNRNAVPRLYETHEEAAMAMLNYIYPISAFTGWEYGGLICGPAGEYSWSRFVTEGTQSQVDVHGLSSCAPYGAEAAHLHTHPPKESPLPSGFLAGTIGATDISNADSEPGIPFYLMVPSGPWIGNMPPRSTDILWYEKKPSLTSSREALFKWTINGWQHIPPPPQ